MKKPNKVLYVASTQSHLDRFHQPYLTELKKSSDVFTMATGKDVDFPILFDKHFFSFSNLRSILQIRKILKRERFDAVLIHTTLAAFLVRAAMFGWRKRPYVLNVVHGYLFSKTCNGMKDRVLLLCEKLLRKQTDDIAVMNAEDLEIAKTYKLCRGQIFFIDGMGITIDPQIPCMDTTLRARYAPDAHDFVCTFVGELSGRKNQIFLIQAIKRLQEKGLPVRLLLVGEGGEHEMLEREIQQNNMQNTVFLLGNCEPVTPYLAMTDLYVSASKSEGLPFNVMEAMSCGLPIVASDTKGQNDLLTAESLYPLDDIEAFCQAAQRVYASGVYGVGSVHYPALEKYRLSAVFENDIKVLTQGWKNREE